MLSHVAYKEADFKLSTAMFRGVFLISTRINFECLFRTLKGPLYEDYNVLVFAKSRTKNVCAGRQKLWNVYEGLYAKFAILDVRLSTNRLYSTQIQQDRIYSERHGVCRFIFIPFYITDIWSE